MDCRGGSITRPAGLQRAPRGQTPRARDARRLLNSRTDRHDDKNQYFAKHTSKWYKSSLIL